MGKSGKRGADEAELIRQKLIQMGKNINMFKSRKMKKKSTSASSSDSEDNLKIQPSKTNKVLTQADLLSTGKYKSHKSHRVKSGQEGQSSSLSSSEDGYTNNQMDITPLATSTQKEFFKDSKTIKRSLNNVKKSAAEGSADSSFSEKSFRVNKRKTAEISSDSDIADQKVIGNKNIYGKQRQEDTSGDKNTKMVNSDNSDNSEQESQSANIQRKLCNLSQNPSNKGNIQSGNKEIPISKRISIHQNVVINPKNTTKDFANILKSLYGDLNEIEVLDENDLNLCNDDECHLLQIPQSIDPKILLNKSINLNKESKIKVNKKKFVVEPLSNSTQLKLSLSKHQKVIALQSVIKIRQYFKIGNEIHPLEPIESEFPFPSNLKVRHPFFGVEYEEKINLSEYVRQKLNETSSEYVRKTSKKKKREISEVKKEEQPSSDEMIFQLLETHSASKMTKKWKLDDNLDFKLKSEIDSEGLIEEPKRKKKKHHNSDFQLNCEFDSEILLTEEPKKKKEKLESNDFNDKRLSIVNSTMIRDRLKSPSFGAEVSRISSDAPKFWTKPQKVKDRVKKENFDKDFFAEILNKVKKEIYDEKQ